MIQRRENGGIISPADKNRRWEKVFCDFNASHEFNIWRERVLLFKVGKNSQ